MVERNVPYHRLGGGYRPGRVCRWLTARDRHLQGRVDNSGSDLQVRSASPLMQQPSNPEKDAHRLRSEADTGCYQSQTTGGTYVLTDLQGVHCDGGAGHR